MAQAALVLAKNSLFQLASLVWHVDRDAWTQDRRRPSEMQRPTSIAARAQLVTEIAVRRAEHPTKYAASPHVEALLQNNLDRTYVQKGAPPPPPLPVHQGLHPDHVAEKCLTRKS